MRTRIPVRTPWSGSNGHPERGSAAQGGVVNRDFVDAAASTEQLAQAMANTTSHEIGHLLGLQHADNPLDFMSTGASVHYMMDDQSLARSQLSTSAFRVGAQHAPQLLLETVGGERSSDKQTPNLRVRGEAAMHNTETHVSSRVFCTLSSCGAHGEPNNWSEGQDAN